MTVGTEFREISHCGGRITFRIVTSAEGQRSYQITMQGNRPVPMALYEIYALPQGVPMADLNAGGIGSPWPPPPVPGCYPVFIHSDSEGRFGFQCPDCQQYWRSRGGAHICPYCGVRGERYQFISKSQLSYIKKYCDLLTAALNAENDGDYVIDMDAVADAAGKEVEKPPFYYAEESQQNQFNCSACDNFNDVIGGFAYCTVCGTRNDYSELENKIIPGIRAELNGGGVPSNALKHIGSAFDTFVGQYTEQLINNRPMRSKRRRHISQMRFHDLSATREQLLGGFDIDICEGLTNKESFTATRMFQRRHVYEHNGGVVDEKYLRDSGDTSVRLKQEIRESHEAVHEFASLIARMAKNLHSGFHDIYEPVKGPIERHEADKKRREMLQQKAAKQGRVSPPPNTAKHHLHGQ